MSITQKNRPSFPLRFDKKPLCHLSRRQREVLQMLVDGWTMKEIALKLVLSYSAVKHHVAEVQKKLGTDRKTLAVARAIQITKEINDVQT